MLSDNKTFFVYPKTNKLTPDLRFLVAIPLKFCICGIKSFALSIGPATNCGKKATKLEKS